VHIALVKDGVQNENQDFILQCRTSFVEHDWPHTLRHHEEMADVTLSDKIEEYIQRLGPSNLNLVSIFVHLLVFGKVKIQFLNRVDRLQLKTASDLMPRRKATALFEKIREDVMQRMSLSEAAGAVTQRIVIEQVYVHLPTKKVKFLT